MEIILVVLRVLGIIAGVIYIVISFGLCYVMYVFGDEFMDYSEDSAVLPESRPGLLSYILIFLLGPLLLLIGYIVMTFDDLKAKKLNRKAVS